MVNTAKRAFFAVSTVAMLLVGTPVMAHATGDTTTATDKNTLFSALIGIAAEISKLSVLDKVKAQDIDVVDVDDVLTNGADILTFNNLLNQNLLNVILLKSVLSNVTVIDNDGTLISFKDFLNDLSVDIDDVVAVKVLDGGKITVFHK